VHALATGVGEAACFSACLSPHAPNASVVATAASNAAKKRIFPFYNAAD
jgi:hypothetical protein